MQAKKLISISAFILISVGLVGCGSSSNEETQPNSVESYRVNPVDTGTYQTGSLQEQYYRILNGTYENRGPGLNHTATVSLQGNEGTHVAVNLTLSTSQGSHSYSGTFILDWDSVTEANRVVTGNPERYVRLHRRFSSVDLYNFYGFPDPYSPTCGYPSGAQLPLALTPDDNAYFIDGVWIRYDQNNAPRLFVDIVEVTDSFGGLLCDSLPKGPTSALSFSMLKTRD